jgi:uncharacterized protein (TIGR02328 family)
MRLWHESLIEKLPRQQLLGQHRECCALRGKGWGKPHSTVNYVFNHSPYKLFQYHLKVMKEMGERGYHPDEKWLNPLYRGQSCEAYLELKELIQTFPIYPEHNDQYLEVCEKNLKEKGIVIETRKDDFF